MSYREPGREADEELERLSREGRARHVEAARHDLEIQLVAGEKASRELAGAIEIALRKHAGYNPHAWALTAIGCPFAVLVGEIIAMFFDAALPFVWAAAIGAAVTALVLVGWASRHRRFKAFLARELAWPASLPFRLAGYPDVLDRSDFSKLAIETRLQWTAAQPDVETVRDVVHRVDPRATITQDEAALVIASTLDADLESTLENLYTYSAGPLVAYAHGLVDEALRPLHDRWPLEIATLRRR
jgi:hypothetical protein